MDFFFLDNVGGSPLLGGNRAFMAEPSDRPAINEGPGGRKKGGVEMQKRGRNDVKKVGEPPPQKKKLILMIRSGLFRPAGRRW